MKKSLLAAAALCALLSTGFAATVSAAAPAPDSPVAFMGAISGIANPGPAETLTIIRRSNGVHWNVTLAATTTVEMRGGVASSYSALNVGDSVGVSGTVTAPRALNAADVRDDSLVEHANGIAGAVRFVDLAHNQIAMAVGRRHGDDFIRDGQFIYVDLAPTTPISLTSGVTGTISSLSAGNIVRVAGVYDNAARAIVTPDYVQVLANLPDQGCDRDNHCPRFRHTVYGRLLTAPSPTAPATLSVRLASGPVISVTVSTTTTVVRRYDGASSLSELALGDWLQINGSFEAGGPLIFDAATIKNVSQQDAYTGAAMRLLSFAPATMMGEGIVVRRGARSPYYYHEVLPFFIPSTVVVTRQDGSAGAVADLGTLRYGQVVYVSGRYDRESHALVVLKIHL